MNKKMKQVEKDRYRSVAKGKKEKMVQSSLVVKKKKTGRKSKSSHHKAIMTQRLLTSFKYIFLVCYDCDVKALFEVWCKVISLVSKQ